MNSNPQKQDIVWISVEHSLENTDALKSAGFIWHPLRRRWVGDMSKLPPLRGHRRGGHEQLWEPCSKCGKEPVDASGLCSTCRGSDVEEVAFMETSDPHDYETETQNIVNFLVRNAYDERHRLESSEEWMSLDLSGEYMATAYSDWGKTLVRVTGVLGTTSDGRLAVKIEYDQTPSESTTDVVEKVIVFNSLNQYLRGFLEWIQRARVSHRVS